MRELHIRLTLSVLFPSEPIEIRSKLIEAIEAEIGEVGDTGSGDGVMDIWMRARKPHAAGTPRSGGSRSGSASPNGRR